MGFRGGRPLLAAGLEDGASFDAVFPLCTLRLDGVAEGIVLGTALTPQQMLEDQERALTRMIRATAMARQWAEDRGSQLGAVGLGSLCAVVAGRGTALQERVAEPVTTGGAATAWALWQNAETMATAMRSAGQDPGAIAILGARSPVGAAVAGLMAAGGHPLRLDNKRAARGLPGNIAAFATQEEAVAGARLVVGAGPTGCTLAASALAPGTVLVDVAIPATLTGPRPPGVVELAGEAVSLPPGWHRGFWGQLYHVLAGYGPAQAFACLVEPLILAAEQRRAPFALGRQVDMQAVRAFGQAADALGFHPRLARGWWEMSPERVLRSSRAGR